MVARVLFKLYCDALNACSTSISLVQLALSAVYIVLLTVESIILALNERRIAGVIAPILLLGKS